MDRDAFWKIIDASTKGADGDDVDAQMDLLRDELGKLPVDEVISFDHHFHDLSLDAYQWRLWAAAYLIGGGCSDDGFIDFRDRLIALGRKAYEAALKDPDTLAKVLKDDEECQIEGFQYIAPEVWAEKTGKDRLEFPSSEGRLPPEPAGERWEEDDLPRMFPKLWKKFGG